MFRIIRQFFSARQPTPPNDQKPETTLIYVRVKPAAVHIEQTQDESLDIESFATSPDVTQPGTPLVEATNGSKPPRKKRSRRVLHKSLTSLNIFNRRQLALLQQIDVRTDRDLKKMTAQRLGNRLMAYAESQRHLPNAPPAPQTDRIRSLVLRGRWAIRFAEQFDAMTPRQALFLRAVHRRTFETLAQDSAGMIRRDLQRLALSSRGKRVVTLDEVPELSRVKIWIAKAREQHRPSAVNHVNRNSIDREAGVEESQPNVPIMPR